MTPFQDIFESFPEDTDTLKLYPFKVRVVATAVSPTHPMFDFFLDNCRTVIERLFNDQPLGRTAVALHFVFPERWMGARQIQQFMQKLASCQDATQGKIQRVDIITGNPIILTDFTSSMIRVAEVR